MNLNWTKYLLGGLYYFFGSNSSATSISLGNTIRCGTTHFNMELTFT